MEPSGKGCAVCGLCCRGGRRPIFRRGSVEAFDLPVVWERQGGLLRCDAETLASTFRAARATMRVHKAAVRIGLATAKRLADMRYREGAAYGAFGFVTLVMIGAIDTFLVHDQRAQVMCVMVIVGMGTLQGITDDPRNGILIFPLAPLYNKGRYWLFFCAALLALAPTVIRTIEVKLSGEYPWGNELLSELYKSGIPNLLVVTSLVYSATFLRNITKDRYTNLRFHLKTYYEGVSLRIISQLLLPASLIFAVLYHEGEDDGSLFEVVNSVFIFFAIYSIGSVLIAAYTFYIGNTGDLIKAEGVEMPNRAIAAFMVYNIWWPMAPMIPPKTRFSAIESRFSVSGYINVTTGLLLVLILFAAMAYKTHRELFARTEYPWFIASKVNGVLKATVIFVAQCTALIVSVVVVVALRGGDGRFHVPLLTSLAVVSIILLVIVLVVRSSGKEEMALMEKLKAKGWEPKRFGSTMNTLWKDPRGGGKVFLPRGSVICDRIASQIHQHFDEPQSADARCDLEHPCTVLVRKEGGLFTVEIPSLTSPSPKGGGSTLHAICQTESKDDVDQLIVEMFAMWKSAVGYNIEWVHEATGKDGATVAHDVVNADQ